jgi:adenylyltransferase/sulfurtransferase
MSPALAPPALDRETLSRTELRRYGRHLVLPEVGLEGQKRLRAARVLLVGTGGLGCPAALYLAAVGVGTLGLVDSDTVELTNLQRQVLFGEDDLERPKVEAAAERLAQLNPHVRLVEHATRLDRDNVLDLLADYDLVLDGSDNAATRYLVNDACVLLDKVDIWGAVSRFEGQVAVFGTARGPCYRCLFPEPPPPGLVPSCAEGGVLGVLPGIIGSLQANEAIKHVLGIGETLHGRLAIFDALRFRWRELRLPRAATCPLCSQPPEERRLLEIEPSTCAVPMSDEPSRHQESAPVSDETLPFEITVRDLSDRLEAGEEMCILDVREPHEVEICRLEGSEVIPMREIPQRFGELDSEALTVVHCHHGGRSAQVVQYLRQQGFTRVTNLGGGIDAWSLEIDPTVPRY